MKEVEQRVAKLLLEFPPLRNDDEALIRVYRRTYEDYDAPPLDYPVTGAVSIVRARQKLQADGYFLPTDSSVIKRRRKQEVKMREYALGEIEKKNNNIRGLNVRAA